MDEQLHARRRAQGHLLSSNVFTQTWRPRPPYGSGLCQQRYSVTRPTVGYLNGVDLFPQDTRQQRQKWFFVAESATNDGMTLMVECLYYTTRVKRLCPKGYSIFRFTFVDYRDKITSQLLNDWTCEGIGV